MTQTQQISTISESQDMQSALNDLDKEKFEINNEESLIIEAIKRFGFKKILSKLDDVSHREIEQHMENIKNENGNYLIPFLFDEETKIQNPSAYVPRELPKPKEEEKYDDWYNHNDCWEYPLRSVCRFRLPMKSWEMFAFERGIIFYNKAEIERLVFMRMQTELDKSGTRQMFVGKINFDCWRKLSSQLRISRPTLLMKNMKEDSKIEKKYKKKYPDGVRRRVTKIPNHGRPKILRWNEFLIWDSSTGFPELINPNWWLKKFAEGPSPLRLVRCKVLKFTLIYRQWNGELRTKFEYTTEFYHPEDNRWIECF